MHDGDWQKGDWVESPWGDRFQIVDTCTIGNDWAITIAARCSVMTGRQCFLEQTGWRRVEEHDGKRPSYIPQLQRWWDW